MQEPETKSPFSSSSSSYLFPQIEMAFLDVKKGFRARLAFYLLFHRFLSLITFFKFITRHCIFRLELQCSGEFINCLLKEVLIL